MYFSSIVGLRFYTMVNVTLNRVRSTKKNFILYRALNMLIALIDARTFAFISSPNAVNYPNAPSKSLFKYISKH